MRSTPGVCPSPTPPEQSETAPPTSHIPAAPGTILALTVERMRQQHPRVSLESREESRRKPGLSTDPLKQDPMSVNRPRGNIQSSCPNPFGNSDRLSSAIRFSGSGRVHPHHRSALVSPVPQQGRCSRSCSPAIFEVAGVHPSTGPTDFLTLGSGVSVGGYPEGAGLTARAFTYSLDEERVLEICSSANTPITFRPGGEG